jgi:hypothetical protein
LFLVRSAQESGRAGNSISCAFECRILGRLPDEGIANEIRASVGLDRNSPRDVFRGLLLRVNKMLTDLAAHFIAAAE